MGFNIIAYGFVIFFICMAVHIVIWRIKVPLVSSLVLVIIFVFVPVLLAVCVVLLVSGFPMHFQLSVIDIAAVLLLHLSLSAAYISSYPAVRAFSPTLDILIMIASSKEKQMTGEDILNRYASRKLVTARIDDLRMYRLLNEENERFELRPFAKFIISIFVFYRKVLGLPAGRG